LGVEGRGIFNIVEKVDSLLTYYPLGYVIGYFRSTGADNKEMYSETFF